mmetsp:Transcript_21399/g.54510  ORF Transcript_21399/g.54510 Transcript_21399/m.54510 type:complete len:295 (+) Transcript_21399:2453-3337(+)
MPSTVAAALVEEEGWDGAFWVVALPALTTEPCRLGALRGLLALLAPTLLPPAPPAPSLASLLPSSAVALAGPSPGEAAPPATSACCARAARYTAASDCASVCALMSGRFWLLAPPFLFLSPLAPLPAMSMAMLWLWPDGLSVSRYACAMSDTPMAALLAAAYDALGAPIAALRCLWPCLSSPAFMNLCCPACCLEDAIHVLSDTLASAIRRLEMSASRPYFRRTMSVTMASRPGSGRPAPRWLRLAMWCDSAACSAEEEEAADACADASAPAAAAAFSAARSSASRTKYSISRS